MILLAAESCYLQLIIEVCREWTVKWKMLANMDISSSSPKSATMVIRKGSRPEEHPPNKWGNIDIPQTKSYKYLGLTFNESLNWTDHTTKIYKKGLKRVGLLSRWLWDSAIDFGIRNKLLKNVLLPCLDYATEVWDSPIHNDRLESIVMRAAKKILNVPTRTHNVAVRSLLGLKSLRAVRWKRKLMFWHRLCNMEDGRLPKHIFQHANHGSFTNQIKGICRRIKFAHEPNGLPASTWSTMIESKLNQFEKDRNAVEARAKNDLALLVDYLDNKALKPDWYLSHKSQSTKIRTNILCSLTQCAEDRQDELPQCPLCNSCEDSKAHWLIECDSLHDERAKVMPLMTGTTREENLLILLNSSCKTVDEFLITASRIRAKMHATGFLEIDQGDSDRALNDNIIDQVIDYYEDGSWWRAKVTGYDTILGLHNLDSTGLDIDKDGEPWIESEVDLNRFLFDGLLRLCDHNDVLSLPGTDDLRLGLIFNDNIIGKCIRVNGRDTTILDYSPYSGGHQTLYHGQLATLNINETLRQSRSAILIRGAQHVIDHVSSCYMQPSPMPKGMGDDNQPPG